MLEMIYFAAIAIVGFFFYRKMNGKPLFGSKKKGENQGRVEKHTAEKSGKKIKRICLLNQKLMRIMLISLALL